MDSITFEIAADRFLDSLKVTPSTCEESGETLYKAVRVLRLTQKKRDYSF